MYVMTNAENSTSKIGFKTNIDIHTTQGKLANLQKKLTEAKFPAGKAGVERTHAQGKLTARERIDLLLDAGSFVEIDALTKHRSTNFGLDQKRPDGDGVVTGYGTIDGRPVCVFSQDSAVFGGSLGEVYGEKIVKVMELAEKTGKPIIGLIDGAGARIQEGVISLALYGDIFYRNVRASGIIPQISVIMGAAAGGHVYSPALTDFVIMVDKTAQMFITGPDVIQEVTGEQVSKEELGGATTHMETSGLAHFVSETEEQALDYVKEILSYLPSNTEATPPLYTEKVDSEEILAKKAASLNSLIPDSPNTPYDMKKVITSIVDGGNYLEIQAKRAKNIICCFARIEGRSVGIVANQPTELAGTLDIDGSEKAARFVRTCDAFNIPILMLVDVPGFLPGVNQEYNGIIRRGAKLLYAYAEATVGKITIITRKAYGGAYIVMGSKNMGADLNFAWPTAQMAVMGAGAAVGFVYRKKLKEAAAQGEDVSALKSELEAEYENTLVNPYIAAERGIIDAVIEPKDTREQIVTGLRILERKSVLTPPKKHGNIPL